jgi:hypothetical protein
VEHFRKYALRVLTGVSTIGSCVAVTAGAQAPKTEVGTLLGVTILSASGVQAVTHVGIPGDGIQASPTVYATIFTSPSVMVEPQLAFSLLSSGGRTLTSFGLALQVGYLFTPSGSGSGYVAANGAFQTVNLSGRSANGPGVGGVVGYRFRVRNNLGIRVDLRYRRWFSDYSDLNEIGFGVGLGALF